MPEPRSAFRWVLAVLGFIACLFVATQFVGEPSKGPADKNRTTKPEPKPARRSETKVTFDDKIVDPRIVFSADGKLLAAFGSLRLDPRAQGAGSEKKEQRLTVWDASSGDIVLRKKLTKDQYSLDFSPDRKLLAMSGVSPLEPHETLLQLIELETGRLRTTFKSKRFGMLSTSFSRDGKLVVSAGLYRLAVWEVSTGRQLVNLGPNARIRVCSFSPDGKIIAGGDDEGWVRFWSVDGSTSKVAPTRHEQGVVSVAFSNDGKTLVTGSMENDFKLWDVAKAEEIVGYSEGLGSGWGKRPCFAHYFGDSNNVVSASENKLRIRDLNTTLEKERELVPKDSKIWLG